MTFLFISVTIDTERQIVHLPSSNKTRKTEVGTVPEGTRLLNYYTPVLEANIMKLSYRGVSYNHDHSEVATNETNIVGKYRGAVLKFHATKKAPVNQHKGSFVYRGVHY